LLDFRNWLAATRDPARKSAIREPRRRKGKIEFFGEGEEQKLRFGPFKLAFRMKILERLLSAQKSIRLEGPDSTASLIREIELHKIRQLWLHEEGDWEDSLPSLYEKAMGERLDWLEDDWSGMGGAEKTVLEEVARECDVPGGLLVELMDKEREFHGMSRRSGVYEHIGKILKKDWRSLEQAWADQNAIANRTKKAQKENTGAN
jgi:DNA sulfur modification protein DndC